MQKKFTLYLSVCMAVAFIVIIGIIFWLQTSLAQSNQKEIAADKINTIKAKLMENEEGIQKIIKEFGEDALVKARTLAQMIAQDPDMIKETKPMQELADLLNVDEVHVTDEKGILWWGNIPGYYGFDFASGDQTAEFLPILENPAFELAQDPQPNAATGKMFQYISVTRKDQKGIVQVGVEPEKLNNAIAENSIDKVLNEIDYGIGGYAFAVDKEEGTMLAGKTAQDIGISYQEFGLSDEMLAFDNYFGVCTVKGEKVYLATSLHDGSLLGLVLPTSELYKSRASQVVIFMIICLSVFLVLILMINLLLKGQVINGILAIIKKLQSITSGNLDEVVEIHTNKEFDSLSNNINEMVSSIKNNIYHANAQADETNRLIAEQQDVVMKIRQTSSELAATSESTFNISRRIAEGTGEQEEYVEELLENMEHLLEKSKESSKISHTVSETSHAMLNNMKNTSNDMEQMLGAIDEMSEAAAKVKDIIHEINSIATSTNMLALNASIEAARAGEMGKGFAVVAQQVGVLANQSAEAANTTNDLITETLRAIARGEEFAKKAGTEFERAIDETNKSSDAILGLVKISEEQASMVAGATAEIDLISKIVQQTTAAASESETTSEQLARQAELLKQMAE